MKNNKFIIGVDILPEMYLLYVIIILNFLQLQFIVTYNI